MKPFTLFWSALLLSCPLWSQQLRPCESSEVFRKLQQFNTIGSVMYLAAHPDDENTRLISYLVHHDPIHTVYLSLTRGDGGQNILGEEQGAALGLIRTYELLEARKIDGGAQAFTPVVDFGFTKSPEETFSFWNREALVQDVVQSIQYFRPDLIICRFPPTGEGGHGQHTASSLVAIEAYEYIQQHNDTAVQKLWLPERVLFNAFRFGSRNTYREGQFKLPTNQYSPLLGESYGEMAGRSRSIHRSQGAGTPNSVGITNEQFDVLAGSAPETSLYDGINLNWSRIGMPDLNAQVGRIIENFNFTAPEKSLPALLELRSTIKTIGDPFWRTRKLAELDALILSCAGVSGELLVDQAEATPGSGLQASLNLIARSPITITLNNGRFVGSRQESLPAIQLQQDSLYQYAFQTVLADTLPLTEPYWLREAPQNHRYQYDTAHHGLPYATDFPGLKLDLQIGSETLEIALPFAFKELDPLYGDVTNYLRIVPPIAIRPRQDVWIYEPHKSDQGIWLQLEAFESIQDASLQVHKDDQLLLEQALPAFRKNTDTLYFLSLAAELLQGLTEESHLRFSVKIGDRSFSKSRYLIQYPHLPTLQYFQPAEVKALPKSWEVAASRVGYIEGVGDYVDDILQLAGLQVESLPLSTLNNIGSLEKFDAVVVGIRAFNTRNALGVAMPLLLEYVEKGGVLIVQYNTNSNLVLPQPGPYPFEISRARVTMEDAPVHFLDPASPLLNYPNRITAADFRAWVQERGLYFPSEWDKRYQTVFSMHDAGEPPLEGGLLYTDYGKGRFIYTGLSFFRQLPAGHTGAIRLFMNLLSPPALPTDEG